jgi:hypothetical protein
MRRPAFASATPFSKLAGGLRKRKRYSPKINGLYLQVVKHLATARLPGDNPTEVEQSAPTPSAKAAGLFQLVPCLKN